MKYNKSDRERKTLPDLTLCGETQSNTQKHSIHGLPGLSLEAMGNGGYRPEHPLR